MSCLVIASIGSDGSLTGYGGGLPRKRWLLEHEARHAGNDLFQRKAHDDRIAFAALHAGPKLLILPNAWDAGSARVIESAGAKAIATSSAAVAWAHGYPDGAGLPFDILLATRARDRDASCRSRSPPISRPPMRSDAATAATTVGHVIDAGAVGINIEDGNDAPDLLARQDRER